MLYVLITGLIIFVASAMATTTGFGSALLGLPLLALVVGGIAAKQSMVVMGVLSYSVLTVRQWREIDFPELKRILLITVPGLIAGTLAFRYLPAKASSLLLGLFVVAVALRGLLGFARSFRAPEWLSRLTLFTGGVVHGAFTTGGPLVVVYCKQALPEREAFRATLGAMWVLLGITLMAEWTLAGDWDAKTWQLAGVGIPALFVGMMAGEYLFRRISTELFTTIVHLTLLAAGSALVYSSLH